MALMPLPPRRVDDPAEVSAAFAAAAAAGLRQIWCNHDLVAPPDADWAHSGVTRVPFLVLCAGGGFVTRVREHGREREVRLRPGAAVLHGPGAYAWNRLRGPGASLTATFDTDLLLLGAGRWRRGRDLDDPADVAPMRALVLAPPPAEPCVSLARAVIACPAGEAGRRLALARAMLWQLAAAAAGPAAGERAAALRGWIAARACTPGLGRAAVARAFGLSPTHVSRLLAPWGGAAAEIERVRLARAAELLRAGPAPRLAAVAAACGFADASHLVRRFRLVHGVTPAAWRCPAAGGGGKSPQDGGPCPSSG